MFGETDKTKTSALKWKYDN